MRRIAMLLVGFLLGCGGGGGDDTPDAAVETCARRLPAGSTGAELTSALGMAAAGDCVVAGSQTFRGNFTVAAGVKLIADDSANPRIEGELANRPALELTGSTAPMLAGITVHSAAGVGVAVTNGAAILRGVRIQGAMSWALIARCDGGGCLNGDRLVLLSGTTIQYNQSGVLADAVHLSVQGGEVSDSAGQTATTGYGIVAKAGAQVDVNGAAIERNQADGLLLDGTGGTKAALVDVRVCENVGRGVWAQGLRGTMAAPALSITGNATLIDRNRFAGVGAVDSLGIIVVNGSVRRTLRAMASDSAGNLFEVGDGVGLFGGSGDTELRDVEMSDNGRAQMLVDQGGAGIIVVNGRVNKGTGEFRIVVQDTLTHAIPRDLLDSTGTSVKLGVAAPRQALP